jgi:F1F0 ATPase subunit 2
MPSTAGLFLSFVVGTLLGLAHFGGLLWTVSRLHTARRPVALALASSAIRLALLVALLLWLGRASFWRLLALLAGLGGGRMLVIWYSVRAGQARKGDRR